MRKIDIESWVDLDSKYSLSSNGRLKNKATGNFLTMQVYAKNKKYPIYMVYNPKKYGVTRKSFSVHRILAERFLTRPSGATEVNHKNGNRKDYRLSNLEWVTAKENVAHAIKNHLVAYGERHRSTKISDSLAKEMFLRFFGKTVSYGEILKIAKKHGVSAFAVRKIIKGNRHSLRLI